MSLVRCCFLPTPSVLSFFETRRGRESPVISEVGWREWPVPRQPWEVRRAWAFIAPAGEGGIEEGM